MKKTKMLLLYLFLGAMVTVGGGYATWKYAHPVINAEEGTLNINLMQFEWVGSEDLPTDVEGQNHQELVTRLVAGKDSNGTVIGLNNPNSRLNGYINDRLNASWLQGGKKTYFSSVAVTGGNEMAELFNAATENVTFLIDAANNLEYYIYTTSVYLGERGEINFWGNNSKDGNPSIAIGEWIYPVYKTKLTRTSTSEDWTIVETKTGRAPSDWYDETRSNANATEIPCFDYKNWEEYIMGGSKNDAIWTFVGDVGAMYTETPETPVWYQIKPKSAGTVTILSTNMNALIKVYNENNQSSAIASSVFSVDGNGENVVKVSWNVSAGTKYYITIVGAGSVPFTVS